MGATLKGQVADTLGPLASSLAGCAHRRVLKVSWASIKKRNHTKKEKEKEERIKGKIKKKSEEGRERDFD